MVQTKRNYKKLKNKLTKKQRGGGQKSNTVPLNKILLYFINKSSSNDKTVGRNRLLSSSGINSRRQTEAEAKAVEVVEAEVAARATKRIQSREAIKLTFSAAIEQDPNYASKPDYYDNKLQTFFEYLDNLSNPEYTQQKFIYIQFLRIIQYIHSIKDKKNMDMLKIQTSEDTGCYIKKRFNTINEKSSFLKIYKDVISNYDDISKNKNNSITIQIKYPYQFACLELEKIHDKTIKKYMMSGLNSPIDNNIIQSINAQLNAITCKNFKLMIDTIILMCDLDIFNKFDNLVSTLYKY